MELTQEYTFDIQHRFKFIIWIIVAAMLLIMARLYYLQVIKGKHYFLFASENSIKDIKVPAIRGMIFDRNKEILVDNRPAYDVVIVRQYMVDKERVLNSLSNFLNIGPEQIEAALEKAKNLPPYYPIVVKADVTLEEVALIQSRKTAWYTEDMPYDLRGVDVSVRYSRSYTDADIASHVLGYVQEIDKDRLKEYREKYPGKYFFGDQIGMTGIEEQYDLALRGRDGFEQKIVNAIGREIDVGGFSEDLMQEPCVHGDHLKLTLDMELQRIARKAFEGKEGGVVAINPQTGAIYALYSAPSFDLNELSKTDRESYWQQITTDNRKFLLNRVTQGAYPPGSTFKVVMAAAALGDGAIKPNETVFCPGHLTHGRRTYKCWKDGGHGSMNVLNAIEQSCDVFFYTMGLRLGIDNIAKYAKLFHLGESVGLGIGKESLGLIPNSEWKERRFKTKWMSGETVSASIGQGYDLMTPMQGALMIATVASGGKDIKPHLVEEIIDLDGKVIEKFEYPTKENKFPISEQIMNIVKQGTINVVHGPAGTARRLGLFNVPMAGKTGTAQVVSLDVQKRGGGKEIQDHAWFVGFAPTDEPQIAVAVIVEHGGHGSSSAAPIAGEIMQKFVERNNPLEVKKE